MLLPAASAVAAATLAAPPTCVAPATVAAPARLAPPPRPKLSCASGLFSGMQHNRPASRLAVSDLDNDILPFFMVRSFLPVSCFFSCFLFRGPVFADHFSASQNHKIH